MIRIVLFFISSLLVSGCQVTAVTKIVNLPGMGTANAAINKIEKNENHYFVYGKLSIEGLEKEIEAINLACFFLKNNQVLSKEIYVDGIAYVLPYKYPIKNGGAKIDVYWAFKQPREVDKEYSLVFNHPLDQSPPCLTYK